MRVAPPTVVTDEQRSKLESWSRGRNTPHKIVLRAKIILLAADGMPSKAIAKQLGTSQPTVALWRKRFTEYGLPGLEKDAPRPGRLPSVPNETVQRIVEATLHTTPANATHWSVRDMADAEGVSKSTVHRIWRRYQLKPHLVETFKLSTPISSRSLRT